MPWICWRWGSVPISSDKEPQPEPSLRLPFRQESEDMMMFQGYDQQTVDFLWGIRFNNDRSWFQEHKEQYQTHLLAPTRALGEQLYDGLHAMLPHEPLILKVSRIYRDARRLHGYAIHQGGEGPLHGKHQMGGEMPVLRRRGIACLDVVAVTDTENKGFVHQELTPFLA